MGQESFKITVVKGKGENITPEVKVFEVQGNKYEATLSVLGSLSKKDQKKDEHAKHEDPAVAAYEELSKVTEENEKHKRQIEVVTKEKEQLAGQNQQLTSQNRQLTNQNQQLTTQAQMLSNANIQLGVDKQNAEQERNKAVTDKDQAVTEMNEAKKDKLEMENEKNQALRAAQNNPEYKNAINENYAKVKAQKAKDKKTNAVGSGVFAVTMMTGIVFFCVGSDHTKQYSDVPFGIDGVGDKAMQIAIFTIGITAIVLLFAGFMYNTAKWGNNKLDRIDAPFVDESGKVIQPGEKVDNPSAGQDKVVQK